MDKFITILYALPVYQSIVLAVLTFFSGRWEKGCSRKLMATFLLLTSTYFAFNLFYNLHRFDILAWGYIFILPVILAFTPVLYLYIVSVTTPDFRFRLNSLTHFLPSLLIFIFNSPYLLLPENDRQSYISMNFFHKENSPVMNYLLFVYGFGLFIMFNIQLIFYIFRIRKLYNNHREYISNHFSYTENINLHWIRALIIFFVTFLVVNELLYIFGLSLHPAPRIFYNVAMLWITLFAGYHGLLQKDLGKEPGIPGGEIDNDTSSKPEEYNPKIKYSRSSLSAEQKQSLIIEMEKLIMAEKIFTNSQLTVDDVARMLGTNAKYISQVLNAHYHKNFYTFINAYRVEEARRLLLADVNRRYSILGISQMAGFSSKSSFNDAFKTMSGTTPSEFRKQKVTGVS